jgi:hypothetical protein
MKPAVAIIIVLIILVGVFIATRGLPGPPPPIGPCTKKSDCPPSQACVKGVCVDPALPGLILNAQAAAGALYGGLQAYTAAFATTYYQHALSLQAVAMGLSSPPLGTLQADLAAGGAAIQKYLNFLAKPSCNPQQGSCGYYAQIMALTPSTPAGMIIVVVATAPSVATELAIATSAFPPAATDLGNVTSYVTADAAAKGVNLDANTQAWMNTVSGDIAALNGATGALTGLATALKQTGYALYSHLTT